MTLFFLSIWCVGREFIDAVDSLLYMSLSILWRFQGLRLLSFCRRFMDQPWQSVFFHFFASAMSLFLLSTWFFRREFIDAVDSMVYLSLSIHWRFQGLRFLCFCRRFMDQPWHSIFDNSMRRPWLYFFYLFLASIVNSLTLSIPCGSCHSVFFHDFKV
jgi:hypothetical protein